jgi:hypothetical protein
MYLYFMKKFTLILSSLLVIYSTQAQKKCASHEHYLKQMATQPDFKANQEALEAFTAAEVAKEEANPQQKKRLLVTIPVVVHVLHNGQAVGNGPNISDAQVLSQIEALTEDYRKKNTDTLAANHPFRPITADVDIEFCLAQRSPTNTPTSGILRYNVGANSFDINDMETIIKPQTIWDRNKYLNLWVGNLVDGQSGGTLLGFAQFPGGVANTDGVAILYTAFGYVGNVQAPSDNGRTAVHEVGHWLNLRHIWGDDDDGSGTCDPGECSGTDQVNDTPNQCERSNGCPTFPVGDDCTSTGAGIMFMNYMDYVTDKCMVAFTNGQKTRMHAAINGSRASLKTSNGCQPFWPANVNDQLSSADDFSIIGNPVAGNELTIRFTKQIDKASVSICSMEGKVLSTQQISNVDLIALPINDVASGVYFVRIEQNGLVLTKKFVRN